MTRRDSLSVPHVGEQVPRQGTRFTEWLGRVMLRWTGWRVVGEIPDIAKCVLIVAPHTSNWDFFTGLWAKFALSLRVSFLGKKALFRFPVAGMLRWLGGVPVDRAAPGGIVRGSARALRDQERLYLVLAPEGTRGAVEHWKTGFYRIAQLAHVPIFPVALDYGLKQVRLLPLEDTEEPPETAIPRIQALFDGVTPLRAKGVMAPKP